MLLDLADVLGINIVWLLLTVEGLGSCVIKGDVDGSFEILFGKDFIDLVAEFSPLDMLSCLWSLEFLGKELELSS